MNKVILTSRYLQVGDARFPIVYLPTPASTLKRLVWAYSAKFSEKWKPIARKLSDVFSAEATSYTLRLGRAASLTNYLVHYGTSPQDSQGCILVSIPEKLASEAKRVRNKVAGIRMNAWDRESFVLNYLIYQHLTGGTNG